VPRVQQQSNAIIWGVYVISFFKHVDNRKNYIGIYYAWFHSPLGSVFLSFSWFIECLHIRRFKSLLQDCSELLRRYDQHHYLLVTRAIFLQHPECYREAVSHVYFISEIVLINFTGNNIYLITYKFTFILTDFCIVIVRLNNSVLSCDHIFKVRNKSVWNFV
jgi:hypothetical protein